MGGGPGAAAAIRIAPNAAAAVGIDLSAKCRAVAGRSQYNRSVAGGGDGAAGLYRAGKTAGAGA